MMALIGGSTVTGSRVMLCIIMLSSLTLSSSCKNVKEWEETLTWESPTRLCTGRFRIYPELVKEKRGPKGSEEITYGAELSIKAEC